MRDKVARNLDEESNSYGYSKYETSEKPRLNLNDLLKRKDIEAKNDKKANAIIFAGVGVLALSVFLILSL